MILEGPLRLSTGKVLGMGSLKDADIKPVAGVSEYTIFPDDLIPRPRRRYVDAGSAGPTKAQVAPSIMATPKNIVGAPKGSVAAQRNVKSKINKHKAIIKKVKGSGYSCAIM